MQKLATFFLLLAACPTVTGTAGHAAGLQVAPALVEVPGNSGTLWLMNENARPLRAQVRVYRWVQENNQDTLLETEDLIASPPFVEVPTDKRQIVRLVRFGTQQVASAPTACEQSFRVIVDELPDFTEENTGEVMNYVMRYSVPVFVQNPKCSAVSPKLAWRLVGSSENLFLEISNTGNQRAQLANVRLIGADGTSTTLAAGLMGYVLPGATRQFAVTLAPSVVPTSTEIEVLLNGSQVRQPVALAISSI